MAFIRTGEYLEYRVRTISAAIRGLNESIAGLQAASDPAGNADAIQAHVSYRDSITKKLNKLKQELAAL